MSYAISLTHLPDVALENVLEHLDFKSILTLRHTCHDLKNFIDDFKPNSNVRSIHICIGPESIEFVFYSEVRFSKIYRKENFHEKFLLHLEIILNFQKIPLDYMEIAYGYRHPTDQFVSLKKISEILKARPRPLSVKHLRLEIFGQNDLMHVLPFINTEKIHIYNPKTDHNVLELSEIVKLKSWKQAKEIDIKNVTVLESMTHFLHFEEIFLTVKTISLEDVVLLKNIFSTSFAPQSFRIKIEELTDRNRLEEVLGPKVPSFGVGWLIPIENSKFGVAIDLLKYFIMFERCPRAVYNL